MNILVAVIQHFSEGVEATFKSCNGQGAEDIQ